jgi:glycosyltransferase involved in cell wall biosynthesis
VIIPTYGRPAFLAEAIESVLAQTFKDFEVMVVDDASPDPVAVPKDPRVLLIRATENGGPARARNLGVEHSTGEVLTFLDDDDTWLPDRLAYAEEALRRAPVAVCWHDPRRGRLLEGDVHDVILDALTPNLGATAVERSAWVPFDETYRSCEDLVWWLAVTRRSRVATHPAQGLSYRVHQGARSGYGLEQRIVDSQRILAEHADYFAAHPRAESFRYKRIGLMQLALGRKSEARKAFRRAVALKPNTRDAWHWTRSFWH